MHGINYSDVADKLFLLQQIQLASRNHCRDSGICQDLGKYAYDAWIDYEHKIKPIVSGYLIEVAAKIRVIQDSLKHDIDQDSFRRANSYATADIPIGEVCIGDFKLDIRESCNKIIHATGVDLVWKTINKSKQNGYTFWTGMIKLSGSKASSEWEVRLNVSAWCVAIDIYLDYLLSRSSLNGKI